MAIMPPSDGTTLAEEGGDRPACADDGGYGDERCARGCVHGASSTRIAPIQPRGAGMGAMMSTSGPENAWTTADHNGFGSWDTRSERKLGCSASSEWGYFSSPLERPSFFGSLPARLRASRKIHPLAVGAAHLIVRPTLDGLPYGGVYAKGGIACVPCSYRLYPSAFPKHRILGFNRRAPHARRPPLSSQSAAPGKGVHASRC